MPTINNATVATGTGLSTAGNGGRKLVRLLNGALISAVRTSTTSWQLHKSLDGGTTWAQLATITEAVNDVTLAVKGNDIHVTVSFSTSGVKHYRYNDSGVLQGSAQNIDTGQTAMGTVSTAINDAGKELHAAWSSKSSFQPDSYNIRYAKGTIAADGSVTWSSTQQITNVNSANYDFKNSSISIDSVGNPKISYEYQRPSYSYIYCSRLEGSNWVRSTIFESSSSYIQMNPMLAYAPKSINGLPKGRLWAVWQGKDVTDNAKFNIYTSFSDDDGASWATPTKQTAGNTYDQTNASLTADSQGKVLLTWGAQNATTTQTALKVFSNGTWGVTTTLTGDGYTNVSTLFDNTFKFGMATPPLIRQSTSGVYFSGTYFTGASISPLSSALGDKTASSVLSYTVTPESGSTITSIVEKVNGTTVNTYSNPASLSRTFTIPLANWDALKYYNTHTISVTVTDSNGMANTQTYTFNKALANDASLLEGTKAAKDGKDRISTKRDVLAGQVGLAAGSTFDAISAQLASGNAFKKFASGTATTTSSVITINGLGFKPNFIMVYQEASGSSKMGAWIEPTLVPNGGTRYLANVPLVAGSTASTVLNTAVTTTADGFTFNFATDATVRWFAFG